MNEMKLSETLAAPEVASELSNLGVEKVAARPGRQKRLEDLFQGRHFDIIKEVHLPSDQRFRTPLGHTGRNGWIVQETADPSNKFIVGLSLLKVMQNQFQAVEIPKPRPLGRPKKIVPDVQLVGQTAIEVPEVVEPEVIDTGRPLFDLFGEEGTSVTIPGTYSDGSAGEVTVHLDPFA